MKRRKFSEAFKRRVLAEIDATPVAQRVLDKHKLSWSSYMRFKRDAGEARKVNGLGLALTKQEGGKLEWTKADKGKRQVPLEALVLLRQARKAWEAGKSDRGKYCALLALTSMEEK